MTFRSLFQKSLCVIVLAFVSGFGCGVDRLQQETLPAEVTGLTLDDLKNIQNDERLTDTEKKEAIRTAIGAPMDSSGDRLVDFLFSLTVP